VAAQHQHQQIAAPTMQQAQSLSLPVKMRAISLSTITKVRPGAPFMTIAVDDAGLYYSFNRRDNYAAFEKGMTINDKHILVAEGTYKAGFTPQTNADLRAMAIAASDILNADDLAYAEMARAPKPLIDVLDEGVDIVGLHFPIAADPESH
jgi:hypothetical protein